MLIDPSSLSAAELFELAQKKHREEQRQEAEIQARVEIQRRRDQLQDEHKQALEQLDKEILALQQDRAQLLARFRDELSTLEQEMAALRTTEITPVASVDSTASEENPADAPCADPVTARAASHAPWVPAKEQGPSPQDFAQAILDIMKGRPETSENLLREQLRARKLDPSRLRIHIDTLIKQGKIVNKGSGNFGLKKKV